MQSKCSRPTHKDIFFVMDNIRHGSPCVINLIFYGITIPCGIYDIIAIAVLVSNSIDNWDIGTEAIISLSVMMCVFTLFIVFAAWLLIKNVKIYKKIDELLSDSIEVKAYVRAKGNQYVESLYMPNNIFEITLHLPEGDIIKTSSTDKSASGNNGWLYRYDGKETVVFYSVRNDKIMFVNNKYLKKIRKEKGNG